MLATWWGAALIAAQAPPALMPVVLFALAVTNRTILPFTVAAAAAGPWGLLIALARMAVIGVVCSTP